MEAEEDLEEWDRTSWDLEELEGISRDLEDVFYRSAFLSWDDYIKCTRKQSCPKKRYLIIHRRENQGTKAHHIDIKADKELRNRQA